MGRVARFESVLNAALLAIAGNAESFREIPGTQLRAVETRPFPGAGAVAVLFTIDAADACTARAIRELPPR